MTSTVMMERSGVSVQGVTGVHPQTGSPVSTGTANYVMVPRCTYKFEKVQGGFKVTCVCEDPVARSMMQHLCSAVVGGLCSISCTLNGQTVCQYNLTMGMTRCEVNDQGCTVTCTSGDKNCCDMIQACCDSISTLCNSGCTCCVLLNNNPICCGYSDSYARTTGAHQGTTPAKR